MKLLDEVVVSSVGCRLRLRWWKGSAFPSLTQQLRHLRVPDRHSVEDLGERTHMTLRRLQLRPQLIVGLDLLVNMR